MTRLSTILALTLAFTASAAAQWPTTEWTVIDEANDNALPEADRAPLAAHHAGVLHDASLWFESLGFAAPLQRTSHDDLTVGPGETYVAALRAEPTDRSSQHSANGYMMLTSHPGLLVTGSPIWELIQASAPHELFHAVQKNTALALYARSAPRSERWPGCPGDSDTSWLIEGTAAAVQVRWLERQLGGRYGHPFAGSSRAAWVRQFDQPLHRGALPPLHRVSLPEPTETTTETTIWSCDYGAWYFWYAVGDMIGRTDAQKVAYLRYVFDRTGSWADGGVANADAGLRAAAEAYDAPSPYRNGLYDLYPEFVAQYLTEDRFYESLVDVDLETPGLFETTGGPLGPLASRAWRVRVQVPTEASSIPYTVRFTLDAEPGTDRDALHLIVGQDVVGRPEDPTAPYVDVQRTDYAEPEADGTVEYLVRVANVAQAAETTKDAEFRLRVEVDGYYGEEPTSGPTATEIGGELPPGFTVTGPGPWACQGGARARAVFDLMTPDEVGRDIDRVVPEMAQDISDMMDNMEIMIQRMEQQGAASGMSPAQIAEFRREAEAQMATARAQAQPNAERIASDVRDGQMTQLLATFVGQTGGAECQMTLGATLAGREGGAQVIPAAVNDDLYPEDEAPGFDLAVFPPQILGDLRGGLITSDPLDGWEVCAMTDEGRRRARYDAAESGCPVVLCTAGQLVLERAEQDRISGSFQFEVIRRPRVLSGRCGVPERSTVLGHFNVASTDDGLDDNSLLGSIGGRFGGAGSVMPGRPILAPPVRD